MKKVFFVLLVIYVCIYSPCIGDDTVDKVATINDFFPNFKNNSTLFVWLNNLRVRETPNLSSEVIDFLQFADEVVYLNQISNITSH